MEDHLKVSMMLNESHVEEAPIMYLQTITVTNKGRCQEAYLTERFIREEYTLACTNNTNTQHPVL